MNDQLVLATQIEDGSDDGTRVHRPESEPPNLPQDDGDDHDSNRGALCGGGAGVGGGDGCNGALDGLDEVARIQEDAQGGEDAQDGFCTRAVLVAVDTHQGDHGHTLGDEDTEDSEGNGEVTSVPLGEQGRVEAWKCIRWGSADVCLEEEETEECGQRWGAMSDHGIVVGHDSTSEAHEAASEVAHEVSYGMTDCDDKLLRTTCSVPGAQKEEEEDKGLGGCCYSKEGSAHGVTILLVMERLGESESEEIWGRAVHVVADWKVLATFRLSQCLPVTFASSAALLRPPWTPLLKGSTSFCGAPSLLALP